MEIKKNSERIGAILEKDFLDYFKSSWKEMSI